MLSISHAATGALIATKISNPLLSIPLVLASHYLEDYIIHWDAGTGLSSGRKTPWQAIQHELVDQALTFLFIYVAFEMNQPGIQYMAWIGAFVSLIPDFVEAPKNFLKWEPRLIRPLNRFHGLFHNSTPNMILGLTPQLILLLVIYLLA